MSALFEELDYRPTPFEAWAEPVTFHNPLQDRRCTQTVCLARTAITAGRVA